MRKEERLATVSFKLLRNDVFIHHITNVAPHGQIFHKQFKEIVVVNRLFELLQIRGTELLFAEQTPFHAILKGHFVGRGLPPVTHQRLAHAQLVTNGTCTGRVADGVAQIDIFFRRHGTFLLFRRVGVAKGHGIVAIGFRRVVEGSVGMVMVVCDTGRAERKRRKVKQSTRMGM
jgi:hypothetical protein